jgi:hypothetical protein
MPHLKIHRERKPTGKHDNIGDVSGYSNQVGRMMTEWMQLGYRTPDGIDTM